MNAHSTKAFYYHAHANSLGGTLRQPLQRVVSTDASASLASAGGFSSQRIGNFHVDGLVSVKAAHVRVSGSEHGSDPYPQEERDAPEGATQAGHKRTRSWRTISAATVEGLNVLEVLTADRIVAQVSVDHPQDGSPSKISLLGSRFENLCVHGAPIKPKLNRKLFGERGEGLTAGESADTSPLAFDELIEAAKEQHKKRAPLPAWHKGHSRFHHEDPETDLEKKGSALCSLVETVEETAGPIKVYSHMVHIPDFGNIFLGELLVSRFSAQLTMVRVEMGCMADGDLSVGSVTSNGRPMP